MIYIETVRAGARGRRVSKCSQVTRCQAFALLLDTRRRTHGAGMQTSLSSGILTIVRRAEEDPLPRSQDSKTRRIIADLNGASAMGHLERVHVSEIRRGVQ